MGKRSGEAQAAQRRRAGPMKHRNTPRGGQRNEQADLHEERCLHLADSDEHEPGFEPDPCPLCGSQNYRAAPPPRMKGIIGPANRYHNLKAGLEKRG